MSMKRLSMLLLVLTAACQTPAPRAKIGVSAALAAETALGPFFIGDSLGEAGRKRFFFAIGRLF